MITTIIVILKQVVLYVAQARQELTSYVVSKTNKEYLHRSHLHEQ